MGGPSKGGKGKKPEVSDHLLTVRRRLHDALSLGMSGLLKSVSNVMSFYSLCHVRVSDRKVLRWQSKDADTQAHALKTMAAFLDCVSMSLLQHPLIQDPILDTVVALGGILQSDNMRILNLAVGVTQKLVIILGNTIHQYPIIDITVSMSHLLSSSQFSLAISSAAVLNRIITSLGHTRGKVLEEVWNTLDKADSIGNVVSALQNYVAGTQPIEYFLAMACLLESILRKWPLSRYPVWSNTKLMTSLQHHCADSEASVVIGALKLFSALALCGHGALKILEIKEFLFLLVENMGNSHPVGVRIEALKLCQYLSRSEDTCYLLTDSYSEPLVQGIIGSMSGWKSSCSKKVPTNQLPLVLESCRAALLTRWAGKHHSFFWKHEIDRVLLDVLLGDFIVIQQAKVALSSDELVAIIYDNSADTRPFVWDILGNLAVHCEESFISKTSGALCYLDFLISCACSVARVLMQKGYGSLSSYMNELEPVSRAVVLMVFSPCKYIASQARYHLSETLRPFGYASLEYVLASLKLNAVGDISLVSDSLHTITNLISLACYSTLPKYHLIIANRDGITSLSSIIKICLNSNLHITRSSNAFHLQNRYCGRECCWSNVEDLEGEEVILFYSLLALSQLIRSSNIACKNHKVALGEFGSCHVCENCNAYDLIRGLQCILSHSFGSGTKWYAACILSFSGFYGSPSKLGQRMAKAIDENELADTNLKLSSGQSLLVHAPIILARCPFLLSKSILKNAEDNECVDQTGKHHHGKLRHEIQISDRVDNGSLLKLLEYVYTGLIQVDDNLTKPLKVLAKCCSLESLYDMLSRKLPKWGARFPSYNLSEALKTTGDQFSDIILEAKPMEGIAWNCSTCQSSTPHLHTHKIILSISCDYLRALFHSGMHDSYSKIIKVPVGWKALTKLVRWFYSGDLPNLNPDCLWNHLDPELQLEELKSYVELCSLAQFWCLEEVEEESFKALVPCISSLRVPSIELIRFAASLNQHKIVDAVVAGVASLYPKLREGGELEDLEEELVDLLRLQYVRYSQQSDT
ncbi:BTB/POZ domain-containing protein At1g04390 isoform X1 [Curcuma longa]|uniref:BTB/POZ domain-containing protein At1g04390 isoform X1 n=1 Tax=Curcuma longa TaxID=136217 RepID=UPI003D9DB3CA